MLLSVALCIPACDQGMPWAPEKSHSQLGCHLTHAGQWGSLNGKHLSEIAGTRGWKDLPGSASPFPYYSPFRYNKSLVIDL